MTNDEIERLWSDPAYREQIGQVSLAVGTYMQPIARQLVAEDERYKREHDGRARVEVSVRLADPESGDVISEFPLPWPLVLGWVKQWSGNESSKS